MRDDMPETKSEMPDDAPHPLQAQAEAAAAMLSALANPHRLMILCLLIEAELPVGALAERVGLSQSALSQHLARMRHQGIVAARREGQSIYYSVADPAVREMIATLYRIYCADIGKPSGK